MNHWVKKQSHFKTLLKKNATKWMATSIAVAILVGGSGLTNAYGMDLFSDLDANHWARNAIENMAQKNVMPGYSDATYKPAQKVSKVELVTISYRILKESGKLGTFNAADSVNRNKTLLANAKIPAILSPYSSDVYTAFGFALDNGLITKEELSTYMNADKMVEATKEQVATLMGKTLNYVKKQNLSAKIVTLSFNDSSSINSLSAPYISLLIDYKLVGKDGDADGNFLPRTSMGRDLVANMANGVYNIINNSTTPTSTSTSTSTTTTTSNTTSSNTSAYENGTISGTITNILTDKLAIEVKDELGKTAVYTLSGTEIVKNNTAIGFLNLNVGENVIINIVNSKANKVVVEKNYSKAEGIFVELSKSVVDTATKKNFRVITLKKSDGKLEYYKIETGLYVEIDSVVKSVEEIKKNDRVSISYDGYFARKISAYSEKSEVLITLVKVIDFKKGSSLTYKLPDGRVLDQSFKSDVELTNVGKGFKKGDIVKATYNYGYITKLEGTGLVAEDRGIIKEILISDGTSKITILNTQNERKTYGIQSKIIMAIGDAKVSTDGLYQLRIGQDVSLSMDALGVYSLTVNKTSDKMKLTLTLMEIVKGTNLLKATDSDGKVWIVNLKDGAAVIENFVPGDKIEVTGVKLSDLIFEAELMTKQN